VFRTSAVLISTAEADQVYHSVEEVPPPLRSQLLNSTNGSNSATILIADRRGRQEIARALENLPGPAQQTLMRSILGSAGAPGAGARNCRRKIVGLIVIAALLLLALAGLAFVRYWH
jgi:hypothetical protein